MVLKSLKPPSPSSRSHITVGASLFTEHRKQAFGSDQGHHSDERGRSHCLDSTRHWHLLQGWCGCFWDLADVTAFSEANLLTVVIHLLFFNSLRCGGLGHAYTSHWLDPGVIVYFQFYFQLGGASAGLLLAMLAAGFIGFWVMMGNSHTWGPTQTHEKILPSRYAVTPYTWGWGLPLSGTCSVSGRYDMVWMSDCAHSCVS